MEEKPIDQTLIEIIQNISDRRREHLVEEEKSIAMENKIQTRRNKTEKVLKKYLLEGENNGGWRTKDKSIKYKSIREEKYGEMI